MQKAVVFVATSLLVVGCAIKSESPTEGSRFKEALPEKGSVALGLPGAESAASGQVASKGTGLKLLGNPASGHARYYTLTRDLSRGVDLGSVAVLGLVLAIADTAPTTVEPKRATWGPAAGSALEPAVWRFVVDEVGDQEYDYRLEGRPKTDTSEAAYKKVIVGHGFGKTHPKHREGWFQFDNSALASLDSSHKDAGTVKVTFDLRSLDNAALDRVLKAEVVASPTEGSWTLDVTHKPDGSGSLALVAKVDVSSPLNGTLEDVTLASRWVASGAGRGDAVLKGADLPATVSQVDVAECWGADFKSAYYKDSVGYETESGSLAACIP